MRKILIALCAGMLGILFLVSFFRPILNNLDLGRHLLLGQIILETHSVPKINLLSYAYKTAPFVNSHWLSEVLFSLLVRYGGFNLLQIFCAVAAGIACLIPVLFSAKRYSPISIMVSSLFYLIILIHRSDLRPEIFSMVFLAIFVTLLYTTRKNPSKIILVLIPLEMLWVNMHIYFIIGPLIVFLFLLERLIQDRFRFSQSGKIYGATLVGTILATLANPNGLQGAIFPLTVFHSYGFPIVENQSILKLLTIFNDLSIIFFVITVFLLFLVLRGTRKNTRPIDWLLAITFSIAGFLVYRNILLFVFTTYLPFVSSLDYLIKHPRQLIKKFFLKSHLNILVNYILVIEMLMLFVVASQSVLVKSFGFGGEDWGKRAADFFIQNKVSGPIFNTLDMGGYLAYRIYPLLVYMDNRPEAYPKAFFQNIYLPMQTNPAIFEQEQKKYKFNTIILSHWDQTYWPNPLLKHLLQHPNYSLIYLDSYAFILVRKNNQNSHLIKKYTLTPKNIRLDTIKNQGELIRYLFFFEKVGRKDKTQEALKQILALDPQLCTLKRYLGSLRETRTVSFLSTAQLSHTCL